MVDAGFNLLTCLLILDLYSSSTIWWFFVALNVLWSWEGSVFTISILLLLALLYFSKTSTVDKFILLEVDFVLQLFLSVSRSWFLFVVFGLCFVDSDLLNFWYCRRSCFLMMMFVVIGWYYFVFWRSLLFWNFGEVFVELVLLLFVEVIRFCCMNSFDVLRFLLSALILFRDGDVLLSLVLGWYEVSLLF